ncbi:MAG TPA: pyruvate kinase [Gemmatimonadales bacterium]|jgi:pyruvate kinase
MSGRSSFRRTKIVATIGPASATPDMLGRMIDAGVDVVRVNSSHGTSQVRGEWMKLVKETSAKRGRHVAILVDLQGPRIRVGDLAKPRTLVPGSSVVFVPEHDAQGADLPTTYEQLADDVTPGARILLDDGLLEVTVDRVEGRRVHGTVKHGGELKSHKGMNLPGVAVSAPAVTDKDKEDIAHAVAHGADFVGISFVRRAEDIEHVRKLVPSTVRLVAKIEKAAALSDLPRILAATDAIMVARGDLGVELPFEQVPLAQKRVIQQANSHGCAVITATQMLESMIKNPRPTRAEASDVANAILDGTDAVMLSAETAVGDHPLEAVEAMGRIIREIEGAADGSFIPVHRRADRRFPGGAASVEDAIALATSDAAELLGVPLILCFTKSGFTPRKVAAFRPGVPIFGLSTEPSTCRHLALTWGVQPELADRAPNYDAMLDIAREALLAKGVVKTGDRILVTAGIPWDVSGTTNLLKVEIV